jgi:hypothetical protein
VVVFWVQKGNIFAKLRRTVNKFLVFALLSLAGVGAWAWSRRPQRDKKPAVIVSPPSILPVSGEKKPVERPEEVRVPNTREEVSAQMSSVRGDAKDEISTRSHTPEAVKPEGAGRTTPERRGGGQMEKEESGQPVKRPERARHGPQLRLVCFKGNDRMWRLAVELPEDFSQSDDVEVRQNGQPLELRGLNENRWLLERLNGTVEALQTRNGGQRWQLEIGSDDYLLFKLLQETETEEGRFVSAPSRGEYLVIVPEDWPVPDSSGIQLSRLLNVFIDGGVGYRFNVRPGIRPRLEFRQRGGQRAAIQFRTTFFTLEGDRTDIASGEYQTPLFLKSPPNVRAPNAESWSQVQKVVLGVAGKGRNKWKKGIQPNLTDNEIHLSEHMNGRKGGWYFLRFYDTNDVLMDSLYFAFATALREIKLSGASALPPAAGHGEARLEFVHDAEATVTIIEHEARSLVGGTAFIVPAPCEGVDWQISWPGEPPLRCRTQIQRVWWALGNESVKPTDSDWTDRLIEGKLQDFRASSRRVLWVRLPWPQWADEFQSGFERSTLRRYPTSSTQKEIMIPLRDFCDAEQVRGCSRSPLSIWLRRAATEEAAAVVQLAISRRCKFCDVQANSDHDAREHFSQHWREFIVEDSQQRRPYAAFICAGCGKVVYSWNETDFSEISKHAARHSTTVELTPIDLSLTCRCVCGFEAKNLSEEQFIAHLSSSHSLEELFRSE